MNNKLSQSTERKIHAYILKRLKHSFNSDAIKVYSLINNYCETEEKPMSKSYIAKQIGLSNKPIKNFQVISDIVYDLSKCGYINIKEVNDGFKIYNYYRVLSLSEFKEFRKI